MNETISTEVWEIKKKNVRIAGALLGKIPILGIVVRFWF